MNVQILTTTVHREWDKDEEKIKRLDIRSSIMDDVIKSWFQVLHDTRPVAVVDSYSEALRHYNSI